MDGWPSRRSSGGANRVFEQAQVILINYTSLKEKLKELKAREPSDVARLEEALSELHFCQEELATEKEKNRRAVQHVKRLVSVEKEALREHRTQHTQMIEDLHADCSQAATENKRLRQAIARRRDRPRPPSARGPSSARSGSGGVPGATRKRLEHLAEKLVDLSEDRQAIDDQYAALRADFAGKRGRLAEIEREMRFLSDKAENETRETWDSVAAIEQERKEGHQMYKRLAAALEAKLKRNNRLHMDLVDKAVTYDDFIDQGVPEDKALRMSRSERPKEKVKSLDKDTCVLLKEPGEPMGCRWKKADLVLAEVLRGGAASDAGLNWFKGRRLFAVNGTPVLDVTHLAFLVADLTRVELQFEVQ
ncbi:hypothetical protein DIPPA_22358 [Diplonema papillatum]|nr:hypothetical protein DIPPA_22358 [Diplonema papillatum]